MGDYGMDEYKKWIDHEYREWIKALQESTVHNFKDHPMTKRMLGDFDVSLYANLVKVNSFIREIDHIGFSNPFLGSISGPGIRMLYYARQVLERNYSSILEIGGGVGEFYAILRAIGYRGDYMIVDLPEVMEFQQKYLAEVERRARIRLPLYMRAHYDACLSFFALGEFDDETKAGYIKTFLEKCDHGFVLWNPHSGASREIPFPCRISDQFPMEHPDCKQLEW
jgi:SAM-dependent methyltransferase